VDTPTIEPDDLSAIMLALMRIEGKVNSIISLLESDGQDDD
jgi:DNA-binding FrmR family transcriptional regulator